MNEPRNLTIRADLLELDRRNDFRVVELKWPGHPSMYFTRIDVSNPTTARRKPAEKQSRP